MNRMSDWFFVTLLAFAHCAVFSFTCRADMIIVGNIASATGYLNGYIVSTGGGTNNSIVQGFTMTDTFALTGADLYVQGFQDNSGPPVALAIYADNGNQRPSTSKLYDLTPTTPLANAPGLVHFEGSGTLQAGTTYWLNLYSTNPSGSLGDAIQWMRANPGSPTGSYATYLGESRSIGAGNPPTGAPSTGTNRTAFQIMGNLVSTPEPSSTMLLALVGAAFGLKYRRSCRGRQLSTPIDHRTTRR